MYVVHAELYVVLIREAFSELRHLLPDHVFECIMFPILQIG